MTQVSENAVDAGLDTRVVVFVERADARDDLRAGGQPPPDYLLPAEDAVRDRVQGEEWSMLTTEDHPNNRPLPPDEDAEDADTPSECTGKVGCP